MSTDSVRMRTLTTLDGLVDLPGEIYEEHHQQFDVHALSEALEVVGSGHVVRKRTVV